MASMGKPQESRKFGGIQMHSSLDNRKKKNRNLSDTLNKMAGQRPNQQYVDPKTHNQIGKDGFLKLLTHQLQNQDPLKPMDQKQFAADLAQFAQLEKLTTMNETMGKMGKNQPTENKFYGASFLGKEVMTAGASIDYNGEGKDTNLPFFLEKSAKNLIIRIFDSKNQLVNQIDKESMGQGSQSVQWDGLMLDGGVAGKDTYRFEVRAWDNKMEPFLGSTKATGIVTGVNFENGETILEVDNSKKVFLRDVDSFQVPRKGGSYSQNNVPVVKKNAKAAYGAHTL